MGPGTSRRPRPLPPAKKTAIRRVAFGNLEKVALTFERPFWQNEGTTHLLHVGRFREDQFPMIIDLQRFIGKPTLVALNAGSMARSLDAMRPGQVRKQAVEVLKRVYGNSFENPVDVAVTNWLADPFSRGSISSPMESSRP